MGSWAFNPTSIKLKKTGSGDVLAKDLDCPSDIQVMNPDLYITSLDGKTANLEMEIFVSKGVGYKPAILEKNDDTGMAAGADISCRK